MIGWRLDVLLVGLGREKKGVTSRRSRTQCFRNAAGYEHKLSNSKPQGQDTGHYTVLLREAYSKKLEA